MPKANRLLIALILGTLSAASQAALTFAFDSANLVVAPGASASFSGTLTVSDDPLYINGDIVNQLFPNPNSWVGVQLDDAFLTNLYQDYPDVMPAGTVWHGVLFNVTLDPSVAPGSVHAGTVSFQGGPTIVDMDPLGSDYNFQVEAVPEPATFLILAAPLLMLHRRKARG